MNKKLKALKENNTWEIVELPEGKREIGNKWVYKTKFNSDETLERYKVRLVAKGYNQVEGIDYTDTFALVSRMTTLKNLDSTSNPKQMAFTSNKCTKCIFTWRIKWKGLHENPPRTNNWEQKITKQKHGMKFKKIIIWLKTSL